MEVSPNGPVSPLTFAVTLNGVSDANYDAILFDGASMDIDFRLSTRKCIRIRHCFPMLNAGICNDFYELVFEINTFPQ